MEKIKSFFKWHKKFSLKVGDFLNLDWYSMSWISFFKGLILGILVMSLFSCNNKVEKAPIAGTVQADGSATYNVEFEEDVVSNWCNPTVAPIIDGSSVQFHPGRVVSKHGYKNISQVSATIDLSGLQANKVQKMNWLNAAFYMVNSGDKQPKGSDYCDSGDTGGCKEIDFLETNGNKIFQSTIHLGDGGSDKVGHYEYAYTSAAINAECYNADAMSDDPSNGLHSLVDVLDPAKPFDMVVDFSSDYTNMTVTVSQNGKSAVIFDLLKDNGAEGSTTITSGALKESMETGWWFTPSYWEGYSPKGPGSNPWFTGNDSKGDCYQDKLCDGAYKISNVKVTAESQI